MHDAAILDHSPQPGFLKAELLLDHPKRMLSFGADMRYGKQKPFRAMAVSTRSCRRPSGASDSTRRFPGRIRAD